MASPPRDATSSVRLVRPDWPAPASVAALATTRLGGCSAPPFDTLNLGDHVGDDPVAVRENRRRLARKASFPAEPLWLSQVHGATVVDAAGASPGIEADASITRMRGVVCAVLTADCLPVLLCDLGGTEVAAIHAGWRGLAGGVIASTVRAMRSNPSTLLAWLGPAIGPRAFEVGDDVRTVFVDHDATAASAFTPGADGRWMADLPALARQRLLALGVRQVVGGDRCTHADREHFFSYRRDGECGRMATCIWMHA